MKKILAFIFMFIIFNVSAENEKGLKIKEIKGNEGKRWAICVGINNYDDENIAALKKAQNDALSLSKVLEEKGQFDKVITLVNDSQHYEQKLLPTKANIEKMIDYVLAFSSPDDLFVFSFSGHGISDDKGEGYLITQDTELGKKFETSLKVSEIVDKFKAHNIKKSLLMLDACREEMTETKGLNESKGLLSKEFRESEVAAAFYSTKAGWYSYEDTQSDYGVFTRFLLEGLNGKADYNHDGIVTFSELENYVEKEVNDYSLKNNRKQKPYTKIYGEKFGDLALTSGSNFKSAQTEITNQDNSIGDISNFKVSLKAGEEFSTAILTWSKNPEKNYEDVIILKSSNKPIDYDLENNVNYIEGEKFPNADIIVFKILKNDQFSLIDNSLEEDTVYYYKIFSRTINNGTPVYSSNGIESNVKTSINEDTIQVRLDKLKILQIGKKNKSWGVELMWKIQVETSAGKTYLLNERAREKYKSFIKDSEFNFDDVAEFKIPKRDTSFFDIVVDMTNLNSGIKVGAFKKIGPDVKVFNNKHYRYNYNDESVYKTQNIIENEEESCECELTWTITKVKK